MHFTYRVLSHFGLILGTSGAKKSKNSKEHSKNPKFDI